MNKHEIPNDPLMRSLQKTIHLSVRVLAVLMTLLIIWGVVDVIYVMYKNLMQPPRFLLKISDILAIFGAFMAVLIAIEIFVNIVIYLRDDVIHVDIVMATALMAIARKVIILDYEKLSSDYILATAAVIMAMSAGYWLVVRKRPPGAAASTGFEQPSSASPDSETGSGASESPL